MVDRTGFSIVERSDNEGSLVITDSTTSGELIPALPADKRPKVALCVVGPTERRATNKTDRGSPAKAFINDSFAEKKRANSFAGSLNDWQCFTSSSENINFKITEGNRSLFVIWGSDIEIDLKLKVYNALVALPENSRIKKIDLTEPRSPIVK